jgi:hypothetical protein
MDYKEREELTVCALIQAEETRNVQFELRSYGYTHLDSRGKGHERMGYGGMHLNVDLTLN